MIRDKFHHKDPEKTPWISEFITAIDTGTEKLKEYYSKTGGPVETVKTATEVGVRTIRNHKVIEWNTCWSVDCQRALMICEEEGCCLEQWCLYIHRLKSGFSRVDFVLQITATVAQ